MKRNTLILMSSIILLSVSTAVRLAASKIIDPAPPLGFVSEVIIFAVVLLLPLALYVLYARRLPENFSPGLLTVGVLNVIVIIYYVYVAFAAKDAIAASPQMTNALLDGALTSIMMVHIGMLFFAGLCVPIIDWVAYRTKRKSGIGEFFVMLGLSLSIQLLLYVWIWVSIFVIAIGAFFISWG